MKYYAIKKKRKKEEKKDKLLKNLNIIM